MADVLKEYLVTLGFKVNDQQYKRFLAPIENATKGVIGLGEAMFGTAAAIFYSVDKIARQYERLYYASQRTGQSVQYLQSYAFAAQQIGLTAEDAQASIEGMAAAIRMNPGLRALAGTAATPADLVARLKRQFGEAGYFVAARFGQMFGLDERTFRQLWMNLDRLRSEEADFAKRQREAGIDATDSAKRFLDFSRNVNTLSSSFNLLATRFALDWLPASSKGVTVLDDLTRWFMRVDKETNGWAITIGTFLLPSLGATLLRVNALRASLALLRGLLPFALAAELFTMIPKGQGTGQYNVESQGFGAAWGSWMPWLLGKLGMTPEIARGLVGGGGTSPQTTPSAPGKVPLDIWGDPTDPGTAFGAPAVPLGARSPGRQSSITQHTNITVSGAGDPDGVARRVVEMQGRVNGDLVRNFAGAIV